MRRMAIRWIEEAQMLPNDGVNFADADDLDYIYANEQDDIDIDIKELLRELKLSVKK